MYDKRGTRMIKRAAQDATITIRLPKPDKVQIEKELGLKGITNLSAWIRDLIVNELFKQNRRG